MIVVYQYSFFFKLLESIYLRSWVFTRYLLFFCCLLTIRLLCKIRIDLILRSCYNTLYSLCWTGCCFARSVFYMLVCVLCQRPTNKTEELYCWHSNWFVGRIQAADLHIKRKSFPKINHSLLLRNNKTNFARQVQK